MHLVLASTSPRRREILAGFGCDFRVVPPRGDEVALPTELAAAQLRESLPGVALAKAREVAGRCGPADCVIAADTVVHHRKTVLGKPVDADEARAMLRRLSGHVHRVYTAVAVVSCSSGRAVCATEETAVRFRKISESELDHYIASGEAMDKAGAYGIQGLAGLFVDHIKGRYDNVVGLPMLTLWRLLLEVGIDLMDPRHRPRSARPPLLEPD